MDLPPQPRPWDTSDVALVAAIAAESGHAVVAIKEPWSSRALETGVREAVSAATVASGLDMLRTHGAQVLHLHEAIGAAHVRMDASVAPAIRSNALVDYVEPRQHGTILGTRSRFSVSQVMATLPLGTPQTVPWGIQLIEAPAAFSVTRGSGAKIQIIDTGHEQGHEDLPLVPDLNCSGSTGGCNDTYPNSHGTHVLGIWTARDNPVGVLGVAPGISPADVYVYGACSSGGSCPTTEVTTGINTAIFTAKVLNLSIGQPFDAAQSNAIAQAWNNDIVIVAAAGNNGDPGVVSYPASYQNVIGVSGVRPDKSFASTSRCGSWSNSGFNVDLAAPFWALSTVPGAYEDETDGWCGTSQSAPHVAGVAALVRARNPTWTNQQVVDKLFDTAEDLGPVGRDDQFGHGLVKAATAVDASPLAPPTTCLLEKIPPPANYLKVSWTNSGESGVSTEVSIYRSGFGWSVVATKAPGITEHFYSPPGGGLYQARVRHVKTGSTPSPYCTTGSVTV